MLDFQASVDLVLIDDKKRKITINRRRKSVVKENKFSYYEKFAPLVTSNEIISLQYLEGIKQVPSYKRRISLNSFEMSLLEAEKLSRDNFIGCKKLEELFNLINSRGVYDFDLNDNDILVFEGQYRILDFGASLRIPHFYFKKVYDKFILNPKLERLEKRFS
ncbi:MAG: hypothetical protein LAT82_00080 [Nanoarchaeota archaeon]|nr:hypothetical protein [Nanoarchaeota archaeon]